MSIYVQGYDKMGENVPGLNAWMRNIGYNMNPTFANLMQQLRTPTSVPQLAPEMMQTLQAQYDRTMRQGLDVLGEAYQKGMGNTAANAARLGQVGSSAHGTMAADVQRGYQQQVSGLHTDTANKMENAIMQLRQMLYGGNLQQTGIAAQMIPQLLNAQAQGFGMDLRGQELQASQQDNLFKALMGIGSAIPGLPWGSIAGGVGGGASSLWDRLSGMFNSGPDYSDLMDAYRY